MQFREHMLAHQDWHKGLLCWIDHSQRTHGALTGSIISVVLQCCNAPSERMLGSQNWEWRLHIFQKHSQSTNRALTGLRSCYIGTLLCID